MSSISQSYVGPYRMLYLIRSGRYSQIWAAIDDVTRERIAVKFLFPEFRDEPEHRASILHEFEVGRTLDHPRVLAPFAVAEGRVGHYLQMELFTGRNLREVIAEMWEPMQFWLPSIFVQAAEAVAYLHACNWVHLDLKPDNFVLNESGTVRMLDFGLAQRPPNSWAKIFWKQRQTTIKGTRSYLSPEQIRREPFDFSADVYGLGCTLYHLVTGVPPFTAPTSDELLTKHLHYPIPNAVVDNPNVTPEFAALLRAMMSKQAASRPASAELPATLRKMKILKTQDEELRQPPTAAV